MPTASGATVAGASAAKAVTVISSQSTVPLASLAAAGNVPLWYQVFAQDPSAAARIQEAVTAGCRAICITIGALPASPFGGLRGSPFAGSGQARSTGSGQARSAGSGQATGARQNSSTLKADLAALDTLTRNVSVPILVKGITTPEEAKLALQHHVQGLIVSSYNARVSAEGDGSILSLAAIVDAVGGRVPVLADGSFRRGTDIIKALAFGAQAVLVGRPVMWGLAAYGAAGVQGVVEMLQTELARYMGMCGKPNVGALDRSVVKVHRPVPRRTPVS